MIRVTVTYLEDDGKAFDLAYYKGSHAALVVEKLAPLGLQSFSIEVPTDQQIVFPVKAHLVFPSMKIFEEAMAIAGEELGSDAAKCSDIQPSVEFSNIAYSWEAK